MADTQPEQLLFQRITQGDALAFRQLVDAQSRGLVTYLTRLMKNQSEAEEVAQDTFVRVWQRAAEFRAGTRASTWIYHIAHNLAVDLLRKRRGTDELDLEQDAAPQSERPSRLLEDKRRALSLQHALDQLPLAQKTAMLLKYEQDFANPEIARILELSVDAVESLLSRAKRQLKQQLKGNADE